MRALLALAILLAGCDELKPKDDPGTMFKVAEHEVEIGMLKAEIEQLKRSQASTHEYTVAVHNSLKETDEAHEALRQTVNQNARIANQRAEEYRQHTHR